MNTPYNTGKVKIGRAYTYTQSPMPDADGWRLQTALLDKPVSLGVAMLGWVFTVSACIALAAVIVHFLSN